MDGHENPEKLDIIIIIIVIIMAIKVAWTDENQTLSIFCDIFEDENIYIDRDLPRVPIKKLYKIIFNRVDPVILKTQSFPG